MLQRCGLNLAGLTTVRASFDIASAWGLFGDSHRLESLSRLCWRPGIRTYIYHNAAQDALYTPQALLLLFYWSKGSELDAPHTRLDAPNDRLDSPYEELLFGGEQDEKQ
jgi:hypothetical protein